MPRGRDAGHYTATTCPESIGAFIVGPANDRSDSCRARRPTPSKPRARRASARSTTPSDPAARFVLRSWSATMMGRLAVHVAMELQKLDMVRYVLNFWPDWTISGRNALYMAVADPIRIDGATNPP
jgi:hypothetical protein